MTEKTNSAAGTSLPDREVGKIRVRKTILKNMRRTDGGGNGGVSGHGQGNGNE